MGQAALVEREESAVTQFKEVMQQQHVMHGMFSRVFERLGGEDFLYEWGEENPGRFITLMCKMTPNLAPLQGMQGDVNLTVNNNLISTALDE